jgi:signal transduction histidine kinase
VAEIKGVEMQAQSAEPLPTMGDPHEIRRAITNLLANAIDATPHGGHVTVRGVRSGEWIEIAVEDDGYGVSEERRAGLFQRFGGGHAGAGTSLGLYIVRRIAEKYGGSVQYAPRSPRGSTFTMKLPMLEE